MIKDKKSEKNAKYRILLPLVVLTIVFLALSFIIAFANKKYGNMMDMFGTNVSTTTFSGVITTIQILVCVFIVLTDYKIGSKLACVLLSCSLIAVMQSYCCYQSVCENIKYNNAPRYSDVSRRYRCCTYSVQAA